MFLLGPDVRFGYFIYPLGLIGWLALNQTTAQTPAAGGRRPVARLGGAAAPAGLAGRILVDDR